MAHPMAHLRGRVVEDDVIAEMAGAGLAGLEVYHRDNDEPAREHLLELCRELDLLVTGSSDYHGTGKPNRLGENTHRAARARRDRGPGDRHEGGRLMGSWMETVVDAQLLGSVFVTLFVIMDPPGTVPIFLALTASMTGRQRVRAARQAVAVAFAVIIAFAVFGRALLDYLHISLPALQCAGGLLLLLVALELLTGKDEAPGVRRGRQRRAGAARHAAAGRPRRHRRDHGLRAGRQRVRAPRRRRTSRSAWACCLVHVCLWAAMRFAGRIHRILGDGGTTLVTRIAGLLLSAIAVQLIADAVRAFVEQG